MDEVSIRSNDRPRGAVMRLFISARIQGGLEECSSYYTRSHFRVSKECKYEGLGVVMHKTYYSAWFGVFTESDYERKITMSRKT